VANNTFFCGVTNSEHIHFDFTWTLRRLFNLKLEFFKISLLPVYAVWIPRIIFDYIRSSPLARNIGARCACDCFSAQDSCARMLAVIGSNIEVI